MADKEVVRIIAHAISNSPVASRRAVEAAVRVCDDLSIAGYALIPREATDEMKARVCAHNNRSTALRAAIATGNILKE